MDLVVCTSLRLFHLTTLLYSTAFSSADSVWYVSVATEDQVILFGSQDYCGYKASNLIISGKLGCIFRGFQYQIPDGYFGFAVPNDINMNLSKVVVTNVVAFALVLISGVHHAYTIRYSNRKNPAPDKEKLYSLAMVHFISVAVCFIFTWVAFIAQAAVIGHSLSQSNNLITDGGVAVYWGQSAFLVLGSAVIHFGWGYEAVRWRTALM
ncbi:hypothetical protein I310_02102 [Cryptococcus deuterogattii CA1014]|nr:hypothetical protein I310_02102 [Cryptococcus deuterogattii CA1014]KIS01023.1 hypothetical protein L804_00892 [Cryptococcus deuterogattii 2001/935-1]